MSKRRRKPPGGRSPQPSASRGPQMVRIVGGHFRGRQLKYSGERCVRPMKDRVREAVFNLIGPAVVGKQVLDLFAGTGALGLEALSRGAERATFLERHAPTARLLQENIATLAVQDRTRVIRGDTLSWAERQPVLAEGPWIVFCSPPYQLFLDQTQRLMNVLILLRDRIGGGSLLVVEADERFDFQQLPEPSQWDVRTYRPAIVGIYEKRHQPPPPPSGDEGP